MCTEILVCHGDKGNHLQYTRPQLEKMPRNCNLATFYITSDGKYAIDADFVDINQLERLDLAAVPKIALK